MKRNHERVVAVLLCAALSAVPAFADEDDEEALICEKGGSGMFFPLFPDEHNWSKVTCTPFTIAENMPDEHKPFSFLRASVCHL
jgi:hypothetical protein